MSALVLFTINLGELPLRDWDEGLVAQVAREIWRSPIDSLTWLHPTLAGDAYFNKPTLVHSLIALTYSLGGVSEWTTRLPSALLTAFSVPLMFAIGREVFYPRPPAVFAALVYLTFLPVVRQGRMAMLDGAILCFLLLMIWAVLRTRRDYRHALGIGISFGLICLTKGVMVGVLLGTIALAFIIWDTPRLLKSSHLWLGVFLGCVPVGLWYGVQWMHYGQEFIAQNLLNQSLQRVWDDVESNGGPPWYYLLEVLKYSAPWLLFLPLGFKLTWFHRNLSWAKLAIVWGAAYLVTISLMSTKLPWYVLPLYPALALIVGAALAELWQKGRQLGVKQSPTPPYSSLWIGWFSLLALSSWAGAIYFGWLSTPPETDLELIITIVGVTMTITAVLVARNNPQFIAVLIWGTYVSLLLLMGSTHWVWELSESYPVKPVAALVQKHTPAGKMVYTSYPHHRPSLNFYSDRQVIPLSADKLKQRWSKEKSPYLLLDEPTLKTLELPSKRVIGSLEGWSLVTKVQG